MSIKSHAATAVTVIALMIALAVTLVVIAPMIAKVVFTVTMICIAYVAFKVWQLYHGEKKR